MRYDHRDVGRSTKTAPGAPDYTGADLADDLAAVVTASLPAPAPDWDDPDDDAAWVVETERPYAGRLPFAEDRAAAIAPRVPARGDRQSSAANHVLVGPDERHHDLGAITALTVASPGHADPPPPTWDRIVPAVLAHTAGGPTGASVLYSMARRTLVSDGVGSPLSCCTVTCSVE